MSDLVAHLLRDRVVVRAWGPSPDRIDPHAGALAQFREHAAAGDWDAAFALAGRHLAPPQVAPSIRQAAFAAVQTAATNPAAMAALATRVDDGDVVAAALLLFACAAGGRPLDLARASPQLWSKSLWWAMDDCTPEQVQEMLRLLHPAMGEWRMTRHLAGILDRTPARQPGDRFMDDISADLQLAQAATGRADALLVCVCGRFGRIGLHVNLFHRFAAGTARHVLYLRGSIEGPYRDGIPPFGPGYGAVAAVVRDLAAALAIRHVGVYGHSGGGFPAARLGLELGARRIVVASGTTRFSRVPETPADRAAAGRALAREIGALIEERSGAGEMLCLFSGDYDEDRADAERLAGLPGVRLLPVAGNQHNVARQLVADGRLGPILAWAGGARDDLPIGRTP